MNYNNINVSQYDTDREIPSAIQTSVVNFVSTKYPIDLFPFIIEPGIGTGRWAIPFSQAGYNIYGVDVSEKMLKILEERVVEKAILNIQFEKSDIYSLNTKNEHFNICIVSHLFHLLGDLEKPITEIIRTLNKTHGVIINIKSGKGNSIPILSRWYIEQLEIYGYQVKAFTEKTSEAFELIKNKGFKQLDIENDEWKWLKTIKLTDGISLLNTRSFSFTNIADEDTHNLIIAKIKDKCLSKYGSLNEELEISNKISLTVFQKY